MGAKKTDQAKLTVAVQADENKKLNIQDKDADFPEDI